MTPPLRIYEASPSGGGKRQCGAQAGSRRRRAEREVDPEAARDLPGDRETETAARSRAVIDAVEALKHAFAFICRNPRPAVIDPDGGRCVIENDAHRHPAAGG